MLKTKHRNKHTKGTRNYRRVLSTCSKNGQMSANICPSVVTNYSSPNPQEKTRGRHRDMLWAAYNISTHNATYLILEFQRSGKINCYLLIFSQKFSCSSNIYLFSIGKTSKELESKFFVSDSRCHNCLIKEKHAVSFLNEKEKGTNHFDIWL